jgi:hypothetical protein
MEKLKDKLLATALVSTWLTAMGIFIGLSIYYDSPAWLIPAALLFVFTWAG